MYLTGQYVEILGWPPGHEGPLLYGLVLSIEHIDLTTAVKRANVMLLSGTSRFPAGEIHQFPSTMLRPMTEHEQARLI